MHSKTFRKFRQESLTVYTLHVNYPYTGSNSTALSSTMTFTHPTAFSTYSYFLAILIFQISKQPWSTSQWVQHTETFLINETHCKNVKELEKGKGDVLELYVIHRSFKPGSCAGCALDDHACANRGCWQTPDLQEETTAGAAEAT